MSALHEPDRLPEGGDRPKRQPMLGERDMCKMAVTENGAAGENKYSMGRRIIAYYESLIDKGVLAVVKTAGIDAEGNCTECGWDADHRYPFSKYCPGCGAKIIEP